jgi:hypothetical protein
MPLVQALLTKKIADAYTKKSSSKDVTPLVADDAAKNLATAYDDWINSAGFPTPPLTFATPPVKSALQAALVAPVFAGWGPGLVAYWTPSTIAGPGLIPVNPLDPGTLQQLPNLASQLTQDLAQLMIQLTGDKATTVDIAADKLASKLFTFTTQLMYMTTTTSVPPVVAQVPVA